VDHTLRLIQHNWVVLAYNLNIVILMLINGELSIGASLWIILDGTLFVHHLNHVARQPSHAYHRLYTNWNKPLFAHAHVVIFHQISPRQTSHLSILYIYLGLSYCNACHIVRLHHFHVIADPLNYTLVQH
jgi:hypothetical protein